MKDSIDYLLTIQYELTQREDVNITFVESRPIKALEEISAMPGVNRIEPIRYVSANLKFKHYSKRSAITGLSPNPDLRRVVNQQLQPVVLPSHGVVINEKLAEILHISVGDVLTVEILEDKRPTIKIPVTSITQEYIGLGAFMDIRVLSHALDEAPKVTGASLSVDSNFAGVLYQKLKEIPAIIGLNITSIMRQIFEAIMAENLLKMVSTNILFASFISFGVIYNTARIALSERGRELASLRVLGLTRKEVAYILFGELGVITLISIPLGIWIGVQMINGMVASLSSELFRIPAYLSKSTFAFASLTILLSAALSFFLVWRQVDKIDLVSAQKGIE